MPGHAPIIMVSSTFFDLKEIRQQLATMITGELGYQVLISESPSFPIEPDLDTIENCKRRVERDADILVLVIGSRYGSIDPTTDKSITNLEYLVARAKGIPIYAFVERRTLVLFDVWSSASPDARPSLGKTIETRLCEFVGQIRSSDKVWTNGFEHAEDITGALRAQLAFLMKRGLDTSLRLRQHPDASPVHSLTGRAFRLALEQPPAWEYLLFAQVLSDEVSREEGTRREHSLRLTYGAGDVLQETDMPDWCRSRLVQLERLVAAAAAIVNGPLQEGVGPRGTPGSIAELVFAGRQLGRIYRRALDWAREIRCAFAPEDWRPVLEALADLANDLIEKVGDFGSTITNSVTEALSSPSLEPRTLTLTLVFAIPGIETYREATERLAQSRGFAPPEAGDP